MNALVLTRKKTPVSYQETTIPEIKPGQVLVQLKAAALNYRDLWITQGKLSGVECPLILGSDGTGVLDGQNIVLNPSLYWGTQAHYPSLRHQILGLPQDGTFAEYIAIDSTQVYPMPAHLNYQEAAALPMEGLTAFRALFTQGRCQTTDSILISNVANNHSLVALQFAIACGATVYVTAYSDEVLEKAVLMGAKGGANVTVNLWSKDLYLQTGGFDLIIDSTGGTEFKELIRLAAPGCRIVTCGGSNGFYPKLNANLLARRQLSIIGSSMGTPAEFSRMLDFVTQHQIVPVIDSVFDLKDGALAFEQLEKGEAFGKIIYAI